MGSGLSRCLGVLACLAFLTGGVMAGEDKIIYGTDDRLEHYEVLDPLVRPLFDSEAMLLWESDGFLAPNPGGGWDIDTSFTFEDWLAPLCRTEPYWDQPVPGFCSGFVVGEDLIATAGHCIRNNPECNNTTFVFGFRMLDPFTPVSHVSDEDVYECQSIVGRVETSTDDWAVIQVDRPFVSREPMPLRRVGAVEADPEVAGLVVIGHPVGLPAKLAGGATVMEASHPDYFEANLDVFGGNSGSAVLSLDPGGRILRMEGILVRGNTDFVWNGTCYESNVCPDGTGCDGSWEESTRSTNFESLVPPLPAPGAVPDGAFVPGLPVTAEHGPGDQVHLAWGPACSPAGADYIVYRGILGDFTSHVPVACSTDHLTEMTLVEPPTESHYYLVVPRYGYVEGSYGLTSEGLERIPSAAACLRQEIGICP